MVRLILSYTFMIHTSFLFNKNIIRQTFQNSNRFLLTPGRKWDIVDKNKGGTNMEIIVGMKGEAVSFVEREDTAKEVGSGSLLVYATPCMVALMEGAACEAIEEAMDEDERNTIAVLNEIKIILNKYQSEIDNKKIINGKIIEKEFH